MNGSSFVSRTAAGLNHWNTLVMRPSVVVYLAIPHLPSAVQDSYRLIGNQAEYDQTLQRSEAVWLDEKFMALVFTRVLPVGTYTLYQVYSQETQIPVFIDVPFADLTDYGEAASAPDQQQPEKLALGKLPRPETGDPLLDPEQASYHLDPELYLGLRPYGDQEPVNEVQREQKSQNLPPDNLIASPDNGSKTAVPARAPTKPAAIMCPPFYLRHRGAVLRTQPYKRQPKKWTPSDMMPADPNIPQPDDLPQAPDLIPPQAVAPDMEADFSYYQLMNRWIYVFQKRGTTWSWFAEYWVDENGGYHAVDMDQARGKERNKRPQPGKDAPKLLSLPYQDNGKKVFNGFFLSGTRLTLQSIQKLEKDDLWPQLEQYDLDPDLYASLRKPPPAYRAPNDPVYPEHTGNQFQTDQSGQYYLRVHDHLWYTISLDFVMQQLRDIATGWLVPAKDLNPITMKQSRQRAEKKLLTETILDLVGSNAQLGNQLNPHPLPNHTSDGPAVMRQWLKDYEEAQKIVFKNVDDAGHMLVNELQSPVMQFVIDSYSSIQKVDAQGFVQDMPLFLDEYSRCMERMIETFQGAEWIAKVLGNKNHFVNEYVLEEAPPDGVRYQVVRKSTTALLGIWNEIAIPYLQIHGQRSVKTLVDSMNYLSLSKDRAVLRARNLILPNTILLRGIEGPKGGKFSLHTDVIDLTEQFAADARKTSIGRISHVLDRLFVIVELVNLGTGIESLIGAKGTSQQVWAAVGVFGSSLDAASAFGVVMGLGKRTLAVIGGISALIDTATATKQTRDLEQLGDISAAIGSGNVAAGSGLIAMGYAMAFFGADTAWSGVGAVVGLVGAVLVALGYIIQFFGTKTPFELFIVHSVWGERYGKDSGDKLWSAGSFESWHEKNTDGLTRQVKAMFNLLEAFTIKISRWQLQIQFGMIHPKTKVQIRLEIVGDLPQWADKPRVSITAELASESTVATFAANNQPGGRDSKVAEFVSYEKGELVIDEWKLLVHLGKPENDYLHTTINCFARLDFLGDDSVYVPSSAKWVDFSSNSAASTSSVDF